MPDSRSPKTRARDIDRAETCSLLDAAYGDGQLGVDDYEARTAAAMHAETLGDLWALTEDLQVPDHLRESPESPADEAGQSHRRGLVLAAMLVSAVVVCGVIGYLLSSSVAGGDQSTGGSGSTAAQPAAAGEPDPIAVEPINLHTADGIREFVRLFELQFRDTIADDVDLYRDDAIVVRMVPQQPHRYLRWRFTGGFEQWTNLPGLRDRDRETVDLAQLDADRIGGLITGALQQVHLPSGRIDRVAIRANDGQSLVTVYVVDNDESRGNVTATLGGEIVEVQTARQG
ncbi:DUF1707 SHOCT-like domain-containing protein [Rhodococcus sp. W8901]|uniref:DUF1707 SHOCT-like domain-containing protein n=1 Tax=Rhodococcus sp. W8901 TaxID=2742603 RepID=UPI0015823E76|nr:DUF1707 domain-containing protein [Rhodococcus sp. W8901]QKT13711.1 DUF1707 domain-containing protein [Rhodococcus sp. W8901]